MMAYWILSGAEWGDWHAVRIDVRRKLRSRLALLTFHVSLDRPFSNVRCFGSAVTNSL